MDEPRVPASRRPLQMHNVSLALNSLEVAGLDLKVSCKLRTAQLKLQCSTCHRLVPSAARRVHPIFKCTSVPQLSHYPPKMQCFAEPCRPCRHLVAPSLCYQRTSLLASGK